MLKKKLLPVAAENGVATIINRPFGEGKLFKKVEGKLVPEWARAEGIETWSAFFLRYIISHPAVTCIIPATSDLKHANQNFTAADTDVVKPETKIKMKLFIAGL